MSVAPKPKVFVLASTYRETKIVSGLLRCMENIRYSDFEMYVVNCNPGDETSELLGVENLNGRVRELRGNAHLYWSGAVNIGLRTVAARAGNADLIVLLNVDIGFQSDIISELVAIYDSCPHSQIGAVSHFGGCVISSGVKVRSWMLALNRHLLAGSTLKEIPRGYLERVDFLPTRCVLFPAEALKKCGFISQAWLPHYAADLEFTNRMRIGGYQPYLCGDVRIESNVSNTGNDFYRKELSLKERLCGATSIKSPYNPITRIKYVLLTYPFYAIPTALIAYLLKTIVEVILGGQKIRRIIKGRDWGFSG